MIDQLSISLIRKKEDIKNARYTLHRNNYFLQIWKWIFSIVATETLLYWTQTDTNIDRISR